MNPSPTITFITGHYYNSARRAGFHNLADAAHRAGFRVNFVTAGYSLLSYLRQDYRTKIANIRSNLNKSVEIAPGFISYVHFTAWHPMTMLLPFLNRISAPFMDYYGNMQLGDLLPIVKSTDIFVFESMAGLFLFKRFKRENSNAKMIYRVSDDVRILGSTHPRLPELEAEIAPEFDCVSVPSSWMLDNFKGLPKARVDRHGIDKSIFDNCVSSPYPNGTKNAVIVATGYVDIQFLKDAALANKNCMLHVIGPVNAALPLPNVRFYGEMPFSKTIPYIKFADVGLNSRTYRKGYSASLSDSLKVIQYRYCGLPIVAPNFIDLNRQGVYYYESGNAESSAKALKDALNAGPNPDYALEVQSWDEVLKSILLAAGCESF